LSPLRRRGTAPEEPPEFFADVALAKSCPRRLAELGWSIVPWWEKFPQAANESIEDQQWIADIAELGLANILTKDDAMYKNDEIKDTLINCGMRLFTLNNQRMTSDAMVNRFEKHRDEIWRKTTVDPPQYQVVTADGLWRRW
jgi:hypothetical protein